MQIPMAEAWQQQDQPPCSHQLSNAWARSAGAGGKEGPILHWKGSSNLQTLPTSGLLGRLGDSEISEEKGTTGPSSLGSSPTQIPLTTTLFSLPGQRPKNLDVNPTVGWTHAADGHKLPLKFCYPMSLPLKSMPMPSAQTFSVPVPCRNRV